MVNMVRNIWQIAGLSSATLVRKQLSQMDLFCYRAEDFAITPRNKFGSGFRRDFRNGMGIKRL